jgi:RNA recognition motif-containing protein
MSFKLFVGNLAYSVTDQDLNDFFASEGNVVSAVVIKDRETDRSKGFGFVEFETSEEAQNAIKNLNEKDLNGRAVSVNEARPREDRRPRDDNRRY